MYTSLGELRRQNFNTKMNALSYLRSQANAKICYEKPYKLLISAKTPFTRDRIRKVTISI